MSRYSLRHLTDDAVTRELVAATSADRRTTAELLARIAEFDRRRLAVEAGYSSTFRYCVGKLRMSEDEAYKRIQAGRAALAHPHVFDAIADGTLSLTAVVLVAPHLTDANAPGLLDAIRHRTIRQVRMLLAERFGVGVGPAPVGNAPGCAPTNAGTLPAGRPTVAELVSKPVAEPPHAGCGAGDPLLAGEAAASPPCVDLVPAALALPPGPAPAAVPARRGRLTPVAPGQFELVAILGEAAYQQLVASAELLGHAVPSGDFAEVLERAIALQFEYLRRRRCGAAGRPRTVPPGASSNPRHVPNAVRRAVWERDGGRCAFVSADGHRCESRDRLELDHVVPVAQGGQPTVENLRLLCQAHNRHAAERAFGRDAVRARIETARSRRAAERMRKEADRRRTEARRAAMARQDEELGTALRNLGYRGEDLRRALALCADREDAPPEARLRHALGCMAPRARRESAGGSGAAA